MHYGSDDIEVFSVAETIRKRPGMYLGDVTRLGAARLVSLAADVLTALVVNRGTTLSFAHHAFLEVSLFDREVTVLIDYHPDECPDISSRCASLVKNSSKLQPDEYALERGQNAVAPMPILSALTLDLCIFRSGSKDVILGLGSNPPNVFKQLKPVKGAFVGARFRIREMIETGELTRGFLEGYLEGSRRVPGLVVRTVKIKQ